MELSSGGWVSCSTGSPIGELGIHLLSVYQLTVLWEAGFGFCEFFWWLFQRVCPFHEGWFMSSTAHTTLSVQQFLTQNGMNPVTHPPYSPNLVLSNFFACLFTQVKKVLKEKHFANVKEEKQKMAVALKGIKTNKFKNCFLQGKKMSQ